MKTEPKPLEPWQIEDAGRLKALFANREPQISQAEFGSKFELGTQGMVSQYLLARRPLNIKAAAAFAHGLGVSVADFSPAIAEQIQQASQAAGAAILPGARRITDDEDHAPARVAIRMVLMHVQAGIDDVVLEPILGDDEHHYVPQQWLEENDLNPIYLLASRVRGDSMRPLMYDGDIVVVNTADKSRKNGGVFAMNYEGQAVIKRLTYDRREWYLTSENPEFRPAPCRGADCIVIGRVVHFTAKNFRDRL